MRMKGTCFGCPSAVPGLFDVTGVFTGYHARCKPAGNEEEFWKSVLMAKDIECEPMLAGTGEIDDFGTLWANSLGAAVQRPSS